MSKFILFFFITYALYQLYFYIKLRRAMALSRTSALAVIVFLLTMPALPVVVRLAERADLAAVTTPLAFAGYLWLGFVFLFVVTGLVLDIGRPLLLLPGRRVSPHAARILASARTAFFTPAILALALCGYGFYDALQIRTETLVIDSPKLAASHSPLRIVQISDVHLGLIVGRHRLAKIIAAVQQARPDILVSTGDLVDGQLDGMAPLAEMLAAVAPRYGKYAVTGNHEYHAGIAQALDFTKRAGFTILAGEAVQPGGLITIAGLDDRGHTPAELVDPSVEGALLAAQAPVLFTLLLKHRPEIAPASGGKFDLQLSGHTHKGQIFPFSLVTTSLFLKDAGLLKLADDCWLYVSRGTGTWGPPIRLLAPPQITVLELRHSDAPAAAIAEQP